MWVLFYTCLERKIISNLQIQPIPNDFNKTFSVLSTLRLLNVFFKKSLIGIDGR